MASVISIHRVAANHKPAELLAEATFIADFGLVGDWRSKKNSDRQITLIEEEALSRVAKTLRVGEIPSGASRRQVLVRGISLNDTIGKRLRVGPLLIEVTDFCHPCRNMEKKIGRGARAAMKDQGGVTGRVIEGGILRPNDLIEII